MSIDKAIDILAKLRDADKAIRTLFTDDARRAVLLAPWKEILCKRAAAGQHGVLGALADTLRVCDTVKIIDAGSSRLMLLAAAYELMTEETGAAS